MVHLASPVASCCLSISVHLSFSATVSDSLPLCPSTLTDTQDLIASRHQRRVSTTNCVTVADDTACRPTGKPPAAHLTSRPLVPLWKGWPTRQLFSGAHRGIHRHTGTISASISAQPPPSPLVPSVVPAAVPRRANLGDITRDRFQVPIPWRPPPTLPSTHPESRYLNSLFGWPTWRSEQRPVDRVQFSTHQLLSRKFGAIWAQHCLSLSLSGHVSPHSASNVVSAAVFLASLHTTQYLSET
ncbi:hypothetical protein CH63R_09099 [Colletotrichum higginsianum IMI 349063]|uniref:Secreted protein n=2 Tax=Colletotrichum higginsianum TaxID=80884 RepID=A0A1B7Y6I1_COLHI|nr:hypothetical protein CH63R_09099 [Colletotrichum higginsianum IMI 349063]OBR07578.1 hypothetical protein CH63R_09099 [Colletotrichum higginsianum IMI 349063]TIC92544.1 hypothetical protein CH35J_010525 [Colletotrichum higginsianum]